MPENEALFGESRLGGLSAKYQQLGSRYYQMRLLNASRTTSWSGRRPSSISIARPWCHKRFPSGQTDKTDSASFIVRASSLSPFENEANQLDRENFGNAITPEFR